MELRGNGVGIEPLSQYKQTLLSLKVQLIGYIANLIVFNSHNFTFV